MFFSKKLKLLFVACPKTGSTSVEAFLKSIDKEGEMFKLYYNGQVYTSSDVSSNSLGHATAAEFKDLLGEESYCHFHTFGFVRDPKEKLVSTYFFKRNGSIKNTFKNTKGNRRLVVVSKTIIGILLARFLPFSIWMTIWPMKRCSDYFLDKEDNIIVDYLGLTDRLGEDLITILDRVGVVGVDYGNVPHVNRSRHLKAPDYFKSKYLNRYIEFKYSKDLLLFKKVENEVFFNG